MAPHHEANRVVSDTGPVGIEPDVASLADRLTRLEATVEALQDQVHRQNEGHQREVADLRHQLKPEELARTLSDDARRRGI